MTETANIHILTIVSYFCNEHVFREYLMFVNLIQIGLNIKLSEWLIISISYQLDIFLAAEFKLLPKHW